MIIHDVEQGSREWWALRLGIPTVSRFYRIVTASTMKYAGAADAFGAELLAERLTGEPTDHAESDTGWTGRGTSEEDEARKWYSFHRDLDVRTVGFVTNDEGTVGGSPDGIVGADEGGVEIKIRSAKHHVGCITGVEDIADWRQVQGYLWLTGLPWWDMVAYNAELPKRIQRAYPDPDAFKCFDECIPKFLDRLERAERDLAKAGDVIEREDDLLVQLRASVGLTKGKDAMTPDQVDALRSDLRGAVSSGILDERDVRQILDDAVAGKTDDVQRMWDYVKRHQPVEAT